MHALVTCIVVAVSFVITVITLSFSLYYYSKIQKGAQQPQQRQSEQNQSQQRRSQQRELEQPQQSQLEQNQPQQPESLLWQ